MKPEKLEKQPMIELTESEYATLKNFEQQNFQLQDELSQVKLELEEVQEELHHCQQSGGTVKPVAPATSVEAQHRQNFRRSA